MLELRPLWVIEMFIHDLLTFLMKLRLKFKFHGPTLCSLHHLTTFIESDSIMIFWCLTLSLCIEIFKARKMANTSAEFISIHGMGLEKIHVKHPLSSLSTPPTAA